MKLACRDCGTVAEPKTVTQGSFAIEVVMWICFLIPGLIYSLWRLRSKHDACRACGSERLVPPETPVGRQLADAAGYQAVEISRPSQGAVSAGRALGRMFRRLKR